MILGIEAARPVAGKGRPHWLRVPAHPPWCLWAEPPQLWGRGFTAACGWGSPALWGRGLPCSLGGLLQFLGQLQEFRVTLLHFLPHTR